MLVRKTILNEQKTVKGMNTKLALIYSYYMYLEFVRGIFPYICSFIRNGTQNNAKPNFWENLCKIDSFPWLPYFFFTNRSDKI